MFVLVKKIGSGLISKKDHLFEMEGTQIYIYLLFINSIFISGIHNSRKYKGYGFFEKNTSSFKK